MEGILDQANIRDFCIIAHIDHGKSTLADRLLEATDTIPSREMMSQVLDTMDLEREKGVTIKASAVRLSWTSPDGEDYQFNLIDTPGHVDFSYEVSRALTACEGALLVVDAAQGIQAQTLANLYLALEADLEIIPVLNKIDQATARSDEVALELAELIGVDVGDVLRVSAKEGWGVEAVLQAVAERIPPPGGDPKGPLQALIFDSHYDTFKGVVAYVRVMSGELCARDSLLLMATNTPVEPVEIGVFTPGLTPADRLRVGEVGYVATGLKAVRQCEVGDTMTSLSAPAGEPLKGYRPAKPMVFAGIYPVESDDYTSLRDALDKLQLNDAALVFEPESSQALQFGFRCGFLGLFHMEIVQERLEREYGLDLIATAPSVAYEVVSTSGEILQIASPADLPDVTMIDEVREPWMRIQIFTPSQYIGPIMDLVNRKRGEYDTTEYLDSKRVVLHYKMPLSEMVVDLHDRLKSVTRGYGSFDYSLDEYRHGDLVRMDILINEEPVDALAIIVNREQAFAKGSLLVRKMKTVIPRQLFKVPIQAAIGGKIIARATVSALRKDVLAKCYGGDISRKRKLLEKQKAGKKRLKQIGQISIPQEAFLAVLRLDED